MAASQPVQNGIICFYSDYNQHKAQFCTDVHEMVEGKRALLGRFISQKRELRIEKRPGTYDLELDFAKIHGLVVKEDAITYAGIHGISLGAVLAEKLCVSFGSTQLPVSPRTQDDIRILAAALADDDWATRRFAILALAPFKEGIDEQAIAQIRSLAVNDRYAAVRREALQFLKDRRIPAPPAPFHLSTFTELDVGWNWSGEKAQDPYYFIEGDGYHISGSTFGYTALWLKALLIRHGFFGFNPRNLINYDLELDCFFVEGRDDAGYGLVLGAGVAANRPGVTQPYPDHMENYDLFCISKNGGAAVCQVLHNQFVPNPVDWVQVASPSIVSRKTSRLKVEARARQFTYYVNDVLIGSFAAGHEMAIDCIGLVITNRMHVGFSRLAIIKFGG